MDEKITYEDKKNFIFHFMVILNRIMDMEKRQKYFGTDHVLHISEIHMIKDIKECDDPHVTYLAKKKDITKGAVSQVVKKLEKKGYVKKIVDPSNLSKQILTLTPKGEIAYLEHEKMHQRTNFHILNLLDSMSEEENKAIFKFVLQLDNLIDKLEKDESQ